MTSRLARLAESMMVVLLLAHPASVRAAPDDSQLHRPSQAAESSRPEKNRINQPDGTGARDLTALFLDDDGWDRRASLRFAKHTGSVSKQRRIH
jgi:hypothetical protein